MKIKCKLLTINIANVENLIIIYNPIIPCEAAEAIKT